ncbi:MAG TPA: response regulator [Blastocatellia bacterium]|nr:response regulator [Blastocatellia bacterium]
MSTDQKANILLVDDKPENLLALEAILSDLNQNLVRAHSGREALRQLLNKEFALVLLDVQMPDMDGFETAAIIRERQKLQHTPIIFLTAINKDERHIFKGYSLGAVDYVCKPLEPEILKTKVKVFIDQFNRTAEVKEQASLLQQSNQELDELNEILEQRVRERTAQLEMTNEELKNEITERMRIEKEREELLVREQHARRQAETANRVKDEFLATLSHELRTPLSSILGWTRLLGGGKLDASTTVRAIETIERNAKAQAQLINDLLDVSRIVAGKLQFEIRPVRLTKVIDAAIDAVTPAANAKDIQISFVNENSNINVLGDSDRLQQIVWNLLSNAVKFTPASGSVEVRLRERKSKAEIVVTDTGQGIDPEFLPYVFERFRQADGSSTRKHGGLGLGLAIVRHLVEMHGGTVQVNSEGEGKGATFIVDLPVAVIREVESEETGLFRFNKSNGELNVPTLQGVRVLVVDDEPDALDMLKTVLLHCGAEVSTASDASGALDQLQNLLPDVLVSDIGMPGEDGYVLINKVRGLPEERGGRTPAIALTAYAREEDRHRALSEGFQLHLAKPIEPSIVVSEILSLAKGDNGALSASE